jgi:hypothetical protein
MLLDAVTAACASTERFTVKESPSCEAKMRGSSHCDSEVWS